MNTNLYRIVLRAKGEAGISDTDRSKFKREAIFDVAAKDETEAKTVAADSANNLPRSEPSIHGIITWTWELSSITLDNRSRVLTAFVGERELV